MKTVILTGGGTAGHVTPNIALIPRLQEMGYKIYYIGSENGMEKDLIKQIHIPYFGISSGKLRRYFDLKNFTDPFKVVKGYFQARRLITRLRPNVVFSKGGFVSVPVVLAAKHKHVEVIIHESDMTPGLANKIAIPAATVVCCNFPETIPNLPEGRAVLTGSPIRQELFAGKRENALKMTGLSGEKPILLVVGGSSGSVFLNKTIRGVLPKLTENYEVIHLCGKGNLDTSLNSTPDYVQIEYANEEMADLLAAADLVISRAGANSICELLALHKPNILIPLSLNASRGDQILNAKSFTKQGFSYMIEEENLTDEKLLSAIDEVWKNKNTYIENMKNSQQLDAVTTITNMIDEVWRRRL